MPQWKQPLFWEDRLGQEFLQCPSSPHSKQVLFGRRVMGLGRLPKGVMGDVAGVLAMAIGWRGVPGEFWWTTARTVA
jgi:hypothetical protein